MAQGKKPAPGKAGTADVRLLAEALAREFPEAVAAAVGPADPRDARTVAGVVGPYLRHAEARLSPARWATLAPVLGAFGAEFGALKVADCTPHLLSSWIDAREGWRSDWTRRGANQAVQAAFNWGARMRLIRENPFKGLSYPAGEAGRALAWRELAALLRHAGRRFRWVLLFLARTGCRPCELRVMTWKHVDWERGVVVLPASLHKTGKKTGRPRVIPLSPKALHLLRRLRAGQGVATQRAARPGALARRFLAACTALRRILERGPVREKEVARRMRVLGFAGWVMERAALLTGARRRRAGAPPPRGYTVFELAEVPPEAPPDAPRPDSEHVFLNADCRPWTKEGLGRHFWRLRGRLGLPPDAKLYGCRHRFGTEAVKAGVDLKTASVLMGHTTTRMTEHYIHVTDDVGHMRAGAERAVGGRKGTA
jgi:integrase